MLLRLISWKGYLKFNIKILLHVVTWENYLIIVIIC